MSITMYYCVTVDGFAPELSLCRQPFGTVKSRHKDWFAAEKSKRSISSTIVFEWETDEKLEVGGIYAEKTYEAYIEKIRLNEVQKCADIIEKMMDGIGSEQACLHLYPLDQFGREIDWCDWMEMFTGEAEQLIASRKRKRQEVAEMEARRASVITGFEKAADAITYSFPAVRGIQARKEYFAAQVPYRYVVKLFTFADESLPPELRGQRIVNQKHARDISDYVIGNRDDYVLPAMTVSVNAAMTFESYGDQSGCLGNLRIPIDAICLINDGQHRKFAAHIFNEIDESLKDESITVVFYYDEGLRHSMQMFADINSNLSKPSAAINALYDKRNTFNTFVLESIARHELNRLVDKENTNIGVKSEFVWSLVHWIKFAEKLLTTNERSFNDCDDEVQKSFSDFFELVVSELSAKLIDWTRVINGYQSAVDLRSNTIGGHAVFLESVALALSCLKDEAPDIVSDAISKIAELSLDKHAEHWQNKCVVAERMVKSVDSVKLTAAYLREVAGLDLSEGMLEAIQRHKQQ